MVDQIIRRQVPTTLFRLHHRTNPNMFKINNIVKLTCLIRRVGGNVLVLISDTP